MGVITLVTGGEVHAPEPRGRQSILIVGERIARLGDVDAGAKGRLEPGRDADLLVIRRETWEIVEVIAKGRRLVRGGEIVKREGFLASSDRVLALQGERADGGE